ncbi:LacI family DNA-binding transcriptional regulator [Pelagicoccus mobilis]|uniref:LacI family DNA-binding transcriptional regulator n=1 Tax=Pelagicoccus mobilis TaxID=415221 RepID=A0A934VTQ4_9BACT|nr:LacI family DNA-binding transcriptional regulator [Pelagicoccus mobilis]MBK1879754.1 LacI family DNA-binding transcriptional regulator [Pelagicoccus mobilis]
MPRPTMQTIADRVGVSKTTVSRVLRNHPNHNRETRKRILDVAEELGYRPNPLVSALMTDLGHHRGGKKEQALALGLIHCLPYKKKLAIQMIELRESLREQAGKQGYDLEEFYLNEPGMTPKRLIEIINARGIQGVIFEHFWVPVKRLDVDLSNLSAVAIGRSMMNPSLHRIDTDHYQAMAIAAEKLLERGYRRIGLVNTLPTESIIGYRREAAFKQVASLYPSIDSASIYTPRTISELEEGFQAWFEKHKPQVVASQHMQLYRTMKKIGLRVPEDVGFVHLDMQKDLDGFAGLVANWGEKGRIAANQLIDQMNRNERGVPSQNHITVVEARWVDGPSI